jgi:DNA ligase-1
MKKKKRIRHSSWKNLDTQERLIFNKLIGGSFRIGVSHKLLVNALSKYSGIDENALMHAIIGKWKVEETQFSN